MEKSLKEIQDEIVDDFCMYDDWLDKYSALIDMGNELEPFPEELRTEDRLIKGCQSRVWLDTEIQGDRMLLKADSDALITKGIIALLVKVYSGRKIEEIAGDDCSFVERLGLKENLSPTRANGLVSMIDTIKRKACEYGK